MLIEGKEYSGTMFVHIPKTAGTSIFNIIYNKGLDMWNRTSPRSHESYLSLKKNNVIDSSVFLFSVVRNPYTRTYSCFHQFNKTNKTNISFIEYLNNIKNNNISEKTPLLHLPQYHYVVDEENNVGLSKIYRFENLKQLESDFGWKLKFDNSGNYMIDLYNKDYTDEAIELTQILYDSDFIRFGYSKNFNDSIGVVYD
jgi:hypothetical protein